ETDGENLLLDALAENGVEDGDGRFDAAEEVARHPVAAGDEHLRRAAILEAEDARVLEKAVDDRQHADVFTHLRHPRYETTDAAHEEVDLHTGAAGPVEGV